MQRWKITIEYKGTNYAGWQIQPNAKTVQGQIIEAIQNMTRCNLDEVNLQGAGRTDSGVHALGQVAHFDICDHFKIGTDFTEFKMSEALNHYLYNEDISIVKAEKVDQDFHARFSATGRSYIYRISDRRAPLTFTKGLVWHQIGNILDVEKMNKAAQILVGTHDFTTFRAFIATNQNPLRTVDYINVTRSDDGQEVHISIGARSFLHNQVRYITGALHLIGYGHWNEDKLIEILNAKDRRKGGPLAPAEGLYLKEITY